MTSKRDLQDRLKDKYGINLNISQSLTTDDCETLLTLLDSQPSAAKLVTSFVSKNTNLSQNNRYYG